MFISNHVWIFMVIIQMMFGGLLRLGAEKQTGSRALNCQCNAPGQYIDMGFLFIKSPFFSHPNHDLVHWWYSSCQGGWVWEACTGKPFNVLRFFIMDGCC